MTLYHYVVQFESFDPEWMDEPAMGHTNQSTFETRHEAVGWMATRMRENPNTAYRLDVYDAEAVERVEKGDRRTHP